MKLFNHRRKVSLRDKSTLHLISVDDILFCEFVKGKSIIHKLNGNDVELDMDLDKLEMRLSQFSIWKSNSNHLINLKYLVQVSGEYENTVLLDGHVRVPIDNSRKFLLLEELSKIN